MRSARILTLLALLTIPSAAFAQGTLTQHARAIASTCPANWESQACLKVVSASNMDLATGYAEKVNAAGKKSAIEDIKQLCAASTAATKGEYPAYAMQSAFTECFNGLYDVSVKTGVNPDQSHYQLLYTAILCLSKDPKCAVMEKQMKAYAR